MSGNGEEFSRSEVAEWEDPATPDRLRGQQGTHFLPLCNTIVVISPT